MLESLLLLTPGNEACASANPVQMQALLCIYLYVPFE